MLCCHAEEVVCNMYNSIAKKCRLIYAHSLHCKLSNKKFCAKGWAFLCFPPPLSSVTNWTLNLWRLLAAFKQRPSVRKKNITLTYLDCYISNTGWSSIDWSPGLKRFLKHLDYPWNIDMRSKHSKNSSIDSSVTTLFWHKSKFKKAISGLDITQGCWFIHISGCKWH